MLDNVLKLFISQSRLNSYSNVSHFGGYDVVDNPRPGYYNPKPDFYYTIMKLSKVLMKIEKKSSMNRNSKNCLNESETNGIYQFDMVVILVKLMG